MRGAPFRVQEEFAVYCTVTEAVAVLLTLPLTPVTVKVRVVLRALLVTVTVRVAVLPGVTEVGLIDPVTPVAPPLTLSVTGEANPPTEPTFTVKVVEVLPLLGRVTGFEVGGVTVRVKVGALTTSVAVTECVSEPLTPVIGIE